MTETIIAALISAAAAILICMINNSHQRKTAQEQHKTTIALIEYKLDQLTAKVEKHNSVVERTYELERRVEVDEEKLKVANHRIDDLEQAEREG